MSGLHIHMFPALQDNYCYLVHDAASGLTGVVDTPEVAAIDQALENIPIITGTMQVAMRN
jgi:hypothetical protein